MDMRIRRDLKSISEDSGQILGHLVEPTAGTAIYYLDIWTHPVLILIDMVLLTAHTRVSQVTALCMVHESYGVHSD